MFLALEHLTEKTSKFEVFSLNNSTDVENVTSEHIIKEKSHSILEIANSLKCFNESGLIKNFMTKFSRAIWYFNGKLLNYSREQRREFI